MKNTGCIGCHQLGQQSTRTIPDLTSARRGARMPGPPHAVRSVRRADVRRQLTGLAVCPPTTWRLDRSRRERRAPVCQADAASRRRAQHRRHPARLDERQAVPARSDRERPALPDRQRVRPAVRIARVQPDVIPILDPVKNVATTFKAPVRDAEMPLSLGPGHAAALMPLQPSPYWGERADLGHARQQPQLDVRP